MLSPNKTVLSVMSCLIDVTINKRARLLPQALFHSVTDRASMLSVPSRIRSSSSGQVLGFFCTIRSQLCASSLVPLSSPGEIGHHPCTALPFFPQTLGAVQHIFSASRAQACQERTVDLLVSVTRKVTDHQTRIATTAILRSATVTNKYNADRVRVVPLPTSAEMSGLRVPNVSPCQTISTTLT